MNNLKKAQNGVITKGKSTWPSLQEKVKIAKKLYKDNPGKIYSDAVKRAEKNLTDSISNSKSKMKMGGKLKKK